MKVWKQALFFIGVKEGKRKEEQEIRGVGKNFPEFFWGRGRREKDFEGAELKFEFGVVLGVSIEICIYICL